MLVVLPAEYSKPHAAVNWRMYRVYVSVPGFSPLLSHARLRCTFSAFRTKPSVDSCASEPFFDTLFAMLRSKSMQDSTHLQEQTPGFHFSQGTYFCAFDKVSNIPTQPVLLEHATKRKRFKAVSQTMSWSLWSSKTHSSQVNSCLVTGQTNQNSIVFMKAKTPPNTHSLSHKRQNSGFLWIPVIKLLKIIVGHI